MNPGNGTCPVKHLIQSSVPNRCPIQRIFNWFRERVSFITDKIPLRKPDKEREDFASASCAFAEVLLEHHFQIEYVLRHALAISINEGQYTSTDIAIEKLFIQYHTSSNGVVSDTLLDAMSGIEQKYEEKFQSVTSDPVIYGRIVNAYPFGVQVVHDIWRNILRAFQARYNRFPTPDETKSFRKFISDFTAIIGKSPALFAVSVRELLVKVASRPSLVVERGGHINFRGSAERGAMQLTEIELGQSSLNVLREKMTNGFCPALPFIPKITDMCCNLLEGAYADIYRLTK